MQLKFSLAGVLMLALSATSGAARADFIGGNHLAPSTALASVSPYTIGQIADGITSDASPYNGFVSPSASGTITLDLDQTYSLSGFVLWNDINVQDEGISHFRLDFFGTGLNPIGSTGVFVGPRGQLAPATFDFATVAGVSRVNLVVIDSNQSQVNPLNRIEVREVGFLTAVPEPGSFALLGCGLLGLATFVASARWRILRLAA